LNLTSWEKIPASRQTTKDHHGNRITQHIEQVFRHHSYELSIRPSHDGKWEYYLFIFITFLTGMPTRVKVSLLIESLTDISEKNMDFTCTLCLHETWKDERLRFRGTTANQSVVLPSRLVDKLWVPDLYVFGSKSSFIHKTTVDNLVMRLYSDGTIFYIVKITSTVACQMNLHNFPLDVEKCSLRLQSLGYTSDELTLEWSVGNHMEDLFMDTRLVKNMPKFQLVHYTFHSTQYNYDDRDKIERVSVIFELKRYLLSVFFQSYFPALIMVVLAGLGMWIDPRSVPARISLGVTSVLTISTVITGLKTSLPKVSYLTAMDVYLWTCFIFVFSTVLEFCVVNY
uniref:Uncharacterized protein n=1 Tax=Ciona intestinalis TaxID=7719 RepID=H2XVB8_CIOIN